MMFTPDDCPICGKGVNRTDLMSYPGKGPKHRCDPKTLARIDGALQSEEERGRSRSEQERIELGFFINELGEIE